MTSLLQFHRIQRFDLFSYSWNSNEKLNETAMKGHNLELELSEFSCADAPTPREADAARARAKLGIGGEHLPAASIC